MKLPMEISAEERAVIEFIRKYGGWVEVIVSKQNGKIVMLKATETQKVGVST